MDELQPWKNFSHAKDVVDRRARPTRPQAPRWMWGVSAGWLVLVGGWQPVLSLVYAHFGREPGWGLGLSFAAVGVAATVVFGFVLGRWGPWASSLANVRSAAPAGCLSWVFWFVIAYAIPIPMADTSADDSGAFGVIVLGPVVLVTLYGLLATGAGVGAAFRKRAGHRPVD